MLNLKGGSASFKNVDVTPTRIYRSLLLPLVAASHLSYHQTATGIYRTELRLTELEKVVSYMPPW